MKHNKEYYVLACSGGYLKYKSFTYIHPHDGEHWGYYQLTSMIEAADRCDTLDDANRFKLKMCKNYSDMKPFSIIKVNETVTMKTEKC